MVVSSWPFACTASIRQERTGMPSSCTVQAPQTPCSQPTCVPARSNSWRRKSLSSIRPSTPPRRYSVPLTESAMSWRSGGIGGPLIGRSQRPARDHARDVALVIAGGVDIAGRRNRLLHPGGSFVEELVAADLSDQTAGCVAGIHRRLADPAQREPDIRTAAVLIDRDDGSNAGDGKIAPASGNLHEAASATHRRRRKLDLDQHLVRLDGGRQQANEEVGGGKLAPTRR